MVPQVQFSIRPEYVALMRDELQGLSYTLDDAGKIALEKKEDFKARLRHSPDFVDCITQSFGFLN